MGAALKRILQRWWPLIAIALLLIIGLLNFTEFFPEEEKELRRTLRETVKKTFPEQAAEVAEFFGLFRYGEDKSDGIDETPATDKTIVILIHGLDEPQKVWMNLAPVLDENNVDVWEMRYPNDGPISESADLFFSELQRLHQAGARAVSIVAHSMGGLVSREMLTSPTLEFAQKLRSGAVPQVNHLIMVGTPNHGSEFARFRMLAEIRDQWVNAINGRGHILRGILDGAGEAKIDLLPESQFLQALNSRPNPENVRMLSIAGIVSPWDNEDISSMIQTAGEGTSDSTQEMLTDLEGLFHSMADGLGDGVVTVESTRLPGVEHKLVRGTHLSMIRNITESSERVAPAIPLVLDFIPVKTTN